MHEALSTGRACRSGFWLVLLAAVTVTASSGCTSVIGSAYLREAWLDAMEHAAEEGPTTSPVKAPDAADGRGPGTASDAEATVSDDQTDDRAAAANAWSPATTAEAMAEADRRLADAGGLGPAARDTLLSTLQATPRQDWPIVIDEFTAALLSAAEATAAEARTPVVSTAATSTAETAPSTEDPLPAMVSAASPPAAAEPLVVAAPPTPPEPAAEPPALAIQNACFASRVRAWSVVDRFEAAAFRPGQDVIVYFELDQLASRSDEHGHTTRVETVLRLVDADGRRLHDWSFEPLEETCGGRRRDYFARYLIAIPPAAPAGQCRLEIAATDAIGGRTARTTLPLEVVAR
jgi:hypothetical protein